MQCLLLGPYAISHKLFARFSAILPRRFFQGQWRQELAQSVWFIWFVLFI
jgi:hypothetical protein